jgi:hypothetical protein
MSELEQEIETTEIETPEEEDSGFEIEVVDDTPEKDRNRPRRDDDKEPEIPEDNEIENYSENVQKRIKQLRFEYHEERRRKEEAERIREEAISAAKRLHEENNRLKKTLTQGEQVLVDQARNRIDAQIEQAKFNYRNAYETGDTDKILEAQENLTALQAEKFKLSDYRPQQYVESPEPNFTQAPQRPQVAEPDAKAKSWAERNPWFQKDPEMTSYAFGVHQRLVTEGYDTSSDEYYAAIDESIQKRFPENFGGSQQRQPGNVVAPASRASKGPRKIKLTQTQVALAKRLGLTNEQYAAQMLKEMR